MLQTKFRLKKRSAFKATYMVGNIHSFGGVKVYYGRKKSQEDFPTRIGFVVSKKIHKRAVVRNRIKRRMREVVRLYIKSNNNEFNTKYMSIIFVATPKLIDSNYQDITNAIYTLLKGI